MPLCRSFQTARESFRFEDADVRLFADGEEVVDDVALDEAAVAEVVREADLVDAAAVDIERRHAVGEERTRLYRAARGGDLHAVAVRDAGRRRELRRDLREELRLQLGE